MLHPAYSKDSGCIACFGADKCGDEVSSVNKVCNNVAYLGRNCVDLISLVLDWAMKKSADITCIS